MNEAQRDRILAVIAKDCTAQQTLLDEETGAQCILGGLLSEAGVTPDQFAARGYAETPDMWQVTDDENGADILFREFGLYDIHQGELIDVNDRWKTLVVRRRHLTKYINDEYAAELEFGNRRERERNDEPPRTRSY